MKEFVTDKEVYVDGEKQVCVVSITPEFVTVLKESGVAYGHGDYLTTYEEHINRNKHNVVVMERV